MQEIIDLKQEIQQIKSDQKDIKSEQKTIQHDIRNLESRTLGNEKDIININKQLDKISANTTWILRLIVGGIIGAALTFFLKGGSM
ncbi:hemolysin XhlA family protein [Bacillus pseudomycoides]